MNGDAAAEHLLRALVAIPSPSGREEAAARFLVNWLAAHGYEEAARDTAGNAIGSRGPQDAPRTLMLLGHIDTVAGQPPLRQRGRWLYGRGTVDAKGSLCAFAAAAAKIALPPGWRVVVAGAVEEEAPSSAGARQLMGDFQPAACLIGEPSGWQRVTLGYKGRLLLHWRWRGPLGHSAGPRAGGLATALAYWRRVEALAERYAGAAAAPPFEQLGATLQSLANEDDGLYERARMTIGLRLPPDVKPAELAADCRALLADGAILHCTGGEVAVIGERNSAPARALRGAIRAHGGRPRFVRKTGTADWNVVARAWHCPTLAYGPGDSTLDHTPEERLHLDEYLRAIAVLRQALPRLMRDMNRAEGLP